LREFTLNHHKFMGRINPTSEDRCQSTPTYIVQQQYLKMMHQVLEGSVGHKIYVLSMDTVVPEMGPPQNKCTTTMDHQVMATPTARNYNTHGAMDTKLKCSRLKRKPLSVDSLR
jgi:hypothetical protein